MNHGNQHAAEDDSNYAARNRCECGEAIGDNDLACNDCSDRADREDRDPECNGHPAGAFDTMVETVYCDGSCRRVDGCTCATRACAVHELSITAKHSEDRE